MESWTLPARMESCAGKFKWKEGRPSSLGSQEVALARPLGLQEVAGTSALCSRKAAWLGPFVEGGQGCTPGTKEQFWHLAPRAGPARGNRCRSGARSACTPSTGIAQPGKRHNYLSCCLGDPPGESCFGCLCPPKGWYLFGKGEEGPRYSLGLGLA